jgi:predicted DNA-binding transcriptional regulator YafY
MRASRLLSLLLLLQVRGRMSAAALAREFEVSVRTIYRDADELSAAGVPVYAERGRNGGFRLLDDFGPRLAALTTAEAEALALSSVTLAAADLGLAEGASAAQRKLLASLPAGTGAARVAARFHLDPLPWYGRRAPPPALRAVADAVWREQRLRISYDSWRGEVRRVLLPLGLVMKAGAWYVVAAAGRAEPRTYRVDAIRTLEVVSGKPRSGEGALQRPRGFDLARHWTASARAFEEQLASARIRVRLTATGLRLLRDFHPRAWEALHASSSDPASVVGSDGSVEATIPFEPGAQGVRDALRMGAEMEVLAPADLRAAVAAEAARSAGLHARGVAAPSTVRRRAPRKLA